MLQETAPGRFEATCDDCGDRSAPIDGSRQLAITRLMLGHWRVRTEGDHTATQCPSCKAPSSSLIRTR